MTQLQKAVPNSDECGTAFWPVSHLMMLEFGRYRVDEEGWTRRYSAGVRPVIRKKS